MASQVWLRDEIFQHGVLHNSARTSKRVTAIRLATILGQLAREDVTAVRLESWVQLSKSVLHWSRQEAELLFELYFMLERGSKSAASVVPFKHFAMLLFVQSYQPAISGSPARQTANSSWPSPDGGSLAVSVSSPTKASSPRAALSPRSTPPSNSTLHTAITATSPRGMAINARATEQTNRLHFIKSHLSDLLWAVYAPLIETGPSAAGHVTVSAPEADLLGFLFQWGSSVHSRSTAPLSCITDSPFALSADHRVSLTALGDWLRGKLSLNEVAYPPSAPALPSPQSGASLPMPSVSSTPVVMASKEFEAIPRQYASSLAIPAGEVAIPRPLSISFFQRATLVKTLPEDTPEVLPALIESCVESFLYILAPLSHALIVGCSHCTIVLGAVAQSLTVENCESVTVVSACARVRVVNCVDCTLHLYTPASPIVSGDCRDLVFAPHNAPYASLRQHMDMCGLRSSVESKWADVKVLSSGCEPEEKEEDLPGNEGVFAILPPSKFAALSVPCPDQKPSTSFLSLPSDYKAALATHRDAVRQLRRTIRSVSLEESDKKQLQAAVQAHFREWLVTSGNIRQVTDLVRLQREAKAERSFVNTSSASLTATLSASQLSSMAPTRSILGPSNL